MSSKVGRDYAVLNRFDHDVTANCEMRGGQGVHGDDDRKQKMADTGLVAPLPSTRSVDCISSERNIQTHTWRNVAALRVAVYTPSSAMMKSVSENGMDTGCGTSLPNSMASNTVWKK